MTELARVPGPRPWRQPAGDPSRIVIVEEEARTRSQLFSALAEAGYVVSIADDGLSGVVRTLPRRYDLVVLDLLPPVVDWLGQLRKLHRVRPELPVLILSTGADTTTVMGALELGACDFLLKPFSLDELLLRTAHAAVRRRSDVNLVRAGRLVLDVVRHQARLGVAVVDLSPREFGLLYLLTRNAGDTVSRERLLAGVWGYGFDPDSNVVEVCVRRLRKKLGAGAPIETVRRLGYRLTAA